MIATCGRCETDCRDGYCTKPRRIYPKTYADLQPCSDGSCMLRKPLGMHTNGGCRCRRELHWGGAHDYPHGALAECFAIITAMRDEIARTRAQVAELEKERDEARKERDEAVAAVKKLTEAAAVDGRVDVTIERATGAPGAPTVALSSTRFFSYDPSNDGFVEHATEDEAKSAAEESLDAYREEAGDGWSEDVHNICWGQINGVVVQTSRRPDESGKFDEIVDYGFLDTRVHTPAAPPVAGDAGALTSEQQAAFDVLFESMNDENPNVDRWEDFTVGQAFKAGWESALVAARPWPTAEELWQALLKQCGVDRDCGLSTHALDRCTQDDIRAALALLAGGGK